MSTAYLLFKSCLTFGYAELEKMQAPALYAIKPLGEMQDILKRMLLAADHKEEVGAGGWFQPEVPRVVRFLNQQSKPF